jgi:DNA-binding NarL/FixJ family response regulator
MPYVALAQLLVTPPAGAGRQPAASAPTLTARQTAVLGLMAEGDNNAVIARTLRCSEHTVKNVIYELMSRLQARNRAHAVAHAVRHGLI